MTSVGRVCEERRVNNVPSAESTNETSPKYGSDANRDAQSGGGA